MNQINDGNSLLPTVLESGCLPKTGAKSALPTQPFSERLPTFFREFSCVSCLKRTCQGLNT
ncbi:MAG: hypothetical protein LBL62_00200 [Planctomycetaceae bacterium]|nr:hypothetical protein [Planctomycetaceae bacterium]